MNTAKRVALLIVLAAVVLAVAAAEQAQAQAQTQAQVQVEQPGTPLLRSADVQQDHNARLDELTGNEVTGVLLAALAVFVAAGGGTGGGGVLDPIYILIMGLDTKVTTRFQYNSRRFSNRKGWDLTPNAWMDPHVDGDPSLEHHDRRWR
jgi:hypothetical protein